MILANDFGRGKIQLSGNVVYVMAFWKVNLAAYWKAKQRLLKSYQHGKVISASLGFFLKTLALSKE